jgi:transcriptional regulator with XRE-family HTH domain
MNIGDKIKRIRTLKELSQKEVYTIANLDAAQYSRIESSKTDPTLNTLERISKALGVTLADLFASEEQIKDVPALDKTIMEKVQLMDALTKDEKQTIYTILDAFVSKRKLKEALKNVLTEAK